MRILLYIYIAAELFHLRVFSYIVTVLEVEAFQFIVITIVSVGIAIIAFISYVKLQPCMTACYVFKILHCRNWSNTVRL